MVRVRVRVSRAAPRPRKDAGHLLEPQPVAPQAGGQAQDAHLVGVKRADVMAIRAADRVRVRARSGCAPGQGSG